MNRSLRRGVLSTAAALLFVAGASGGAIPAAANAQGVRQPQNSFRVPNGYRIVPGPAVAGPQIAPLPRWNRSGFMMPVPKIQEVLFVADANNNEIDAYTPKGKIGAITQGIDCPDGVAVDGAGTLYVANACNATITEYPFGKASPSFTINSGLSSPYGIGVDSNGNVFASNLGNNTVTAYKPGQTSPFETVSGVGPNPVGVAIDSKNDVYVADDSNNTIYIIPAGSSTAQDSGITQLTGPIGVAFTTGDTLYVSDFSANEVGIYPSGSTTPSGTITTGINQPTLNGFARPSFFFQSDQTGPVVGYKPGQTSPFDTISGIGRPLGIASYPRVTP